MFEKVIVKHFTPYGQSVLGLESQFADLYAAAFREDISSKLSLRQFPADAICFTRRTAATLSRQILQTRLTRKWPYGYV